MGKAVVDPEELAHFALELRRFSGELQTEVGGLNRQFVRLGETWRDQEHERFAEEFALMARTLTRFAGLAEAQVPVLLRKAEAIRAYLRSR